MKKSATRVTLIMVCVVVGVVAYYAYLSNKTRDARKEAALTAVQEVLSRDLGKDYPPSPKEVIKYYNRILECFYNEECTEEEIEALGAQARKLYDEELLAANEEDQYYARLKEDIAEYKESKKRIGSSSVAASTSVDTFKEDGNSFARIHCGYSVLEKGVNVAVNEVYLLRKDQNRHWKIYGWDLAENVNPGVEDSDD